MIENRITLIGTAVVQYQAKQVWMILELRSQVKTKLPTKEQMIVMDCQRIAGRQTRYRLIQAISGHRNTFDGWQKACQLPCLLDCIITIQIQSSLSLSVGVEICSLRKARGIVITNSH